MAEQRKRSKAKETMSCKTCNKNFLEASELMDHQRIHEELATNAVRVHDLFERPYACDECGKTFSTRRTLLKHQRLHSGILPFSCSVCNKTFYQISRWIDHSRIHTGANHFPCSLCLEIFTRKDDFLEHLQKHNLKPHLHKERAGSSKDDCFHVKKESLTQKGEKYGKIFSPEHYTDLGMKKKTEQDQSKQTIKNQLSSETVDHETDSVTNYSFYTHGEGYKSLRCSKEVLESIAKDRRLWKDPFVCKYCGGTFTRKQGLEIHVKRVHTSNKGSRNMFCELCFKFFARKDIMAMVDLDNITYCVPYTSYGSRSLEGRKSILLVLSCSACMFACNKTCTLCDKTVRLCDLRTHLKFHTGELVPCKICGKIFSDTRTLVSHMHSCQAQCAICDKTFSNVTALADHRDVVHWSDEDLFRISYTK